jgi:hypothetical protein
MDGKVSKNFSERGKGHISVIELDPTGSFKPPIKVLAREYHLSYPFVFQWQGHSYMSPETASNQTVEFCKCTVLPAEWQLEKVVLEDINATKSYLCGIRTSSLRPL